MPYRSNLQSCIDLRCPAWLTQDADFQQSSSTSSFEDQNISSIPPASLSLQKLIVRSYLHVRLSPRKKGQTLKPCLFCVGFQGTPSPYPIAEPPLNSYCTRIASNHGRAGSSGVCQWCRFGQGLLLRYADRRVCNHHAPSGTLTWDLGTLVSDEAATYHPHGQD